MARRALSALAPLLLLATLAAALAPPAGAQGPPCRPCAGLVAATPAQVDAIASELASSAGFEERQPLYVAWSFALDPGPSAEAGATPVGVEAAVAATRAVRRAGATPWVRLVFSTPPPLVENTPHLDLELAAAAALARDAADATHFEVVWQPRGPASQAAASDTADPEGYAFLIKRASVAITGAQPGARVIAGTFAARPDVLEALYDQDVAAYLDGIALAPPAEGAGGDALAAALAALAELDPGRPVVVDGEPLPDPASGALATAARQAAAGVAVTLFDLPETAEVTPATVSPFVVLAREFQGDLSYDASYGPKGSPDGAWSFVRGKDLALRVIATTGGTGAVPEAAPGAPIAETPEVTLTFPDPQLISPDEVDPATGEVRALFGVRRTVEGISVPVPADWPVAVLRVERSEATDLASTVKERVNVAGERQIPVEEILRRLQANEDAQARRLDHFSATNTTHLRFGAGAGQQNVEATLEGAFFFRQGKGFDWAWQRFYLNGVRWRGKSIPEIPLVQPEKAATLPIEISFTRQYTYQLAGSDTVDGRDCWVVEFRPAVAPEEGKLYRGRVWIDKQLYLRVRSRAVQLGLEGEVLSNEETLDYTPVDAAGQTAAWGAAESFVLPLRLTGQQLLSVVNSTTLVERETDLADVTINGPGFEERRQAVMSSDATMVRDTDQGLRYLVKQEGSDERVVKEGFDTGRLFAVGGVFYDDALDYPLPLAGANYLDFDFRKTGNQLNLFFAGALTTISYADPRVGDSRFDLGGDLFALVVPFTDTVYRDGRERTDEEVKARTSNLSLKAGHPLGNFVKLGAEYDLTWLDYTTTGNTADGFSAPSSHLRHTFSLNGRFARAGYSLGLSGGYHRRSKWEPWGFADNPELSADSQSYLTWEGSVAKTWSLPAFQKVGAEIHYAGGRDLDRFSKYQFGFFGSNRVQGYQSNRVRAEKLWATHLSYGFEIGKVVRIDAVGDVAWATDRLSGLDNEVLAGVGIQGTFMGPWQTIVNLDVGTPVAGPDHGFGLYLAFLKLFDWPRLEHWLDPTDQ